MICILRIDCKKLIFFIVIVALSSIILVFSASALTGIIQSDENSLELSDGVYNIINLKSGQHLDVYDLVHDSSGKAYLSEKSALNGQDFLVKKQDDGTYIIFPQSENGTYSLSYETDIMESEFISKKDTLSSQSKFNIDPVVTEEGAVNRYTIKPACMGDNMLSLDISSSKGAFDYSLVGLALENNSTSQQWVFIKASPDTLLVDGGYVNVKIGTYHDVYASVSPNYLSDNLTWESSDPEIATVDSNGMVYAVSVGKATITAFCGTQQVSTVVSVSDRIAFTWYSQHNTTTGGWFADSLSNLYFSTWAGERKRFFVNGYAYNYDWMDQGCKLCAEAMVLHNMGALLTTGYDFRTGEENNLEADPFTVALANSGSDGYNINSTWLPNNPVLINHSMIDPRFTVNGKQITTQNYYGNNLSHIKELLEQHPEGVIVGMCNTAKNTTHYVVFTECLNPDDPYGNYEFRICDSAAYDAELGDNVPFKESCSYLNLGYGYWSIFCYSVYNIVE